MSDQPLNLTATLVAARTDVTLGDGKRDTNRITLQLTNPGQAAVTFGDGFGSRGSFTLGFTVGPEAEDLVQGLEESVDLAIEAPDDWQPQPYKKVGNRALYAFRLPRRVFAPGESKTLVLKHFICRSAPGQARLALDFRITGYQPFSGVLAVEKRAEVFDLLFFEAHPLNITTEREQQGFTLSWSTLQAGRLELKKNDTRLATFTAGLDGFDNGRPFTYRLEQPSLPDTVYTLTAWDGADASRSRTLQARVHVLPSGWYATRFRRFGYPAVLCDLDGVALYGVFIDRGHARLCSSQHPYSAWDLENDQVPREMATSPAAGFRNRVWLVGGSAVDTDNCSSRLWSYDPARAEAQTSEAPWPARMGHACVVFDDRLWVLGGMDADGNPLRDVHSLDAAGNWQHHPDAPWQPRCLPAAAAHDGRLWIHGGCAEPFGDPRPDMWTLDAKGRWSEHEQLPGPPRYDLTQPISSTLQVIGNELHLLGSFRSGYGVQAMQGRWNPLQNTWFIQQVGHPWNQQGENTHSLSGAVFNGLLFLRSLNWRIDDNPTELYMMKP